MKITYKNYTLVPAIGCEDRSDIFKTITVTVKSDKTPKGKKRNDGLKIGDTYKKDEVVDFGMRLANAVHKIILYSLAENEETTDLKGFLAEYRKDVDIIEKMLDK